jgi:hypothetical protein
MLASECSARFSFPFRRRRFCFLEPSLAQKFHDDDYVQHVRGNLEQSSKWAETDRSSQGPRAAFSAEATRTFPSRPLRPMVVSLRTVRTPRALLPNLATAASVPLSSFPPKSQKGIKFR